MTNDKNPYHGEKIIFITHVGETTTNTQGYLENTHTHTHTVRWTEDLMQNFILYTNTKEIKTLSSTQQQDMNAKCRAYANLSLCNNALSFKSPASAKSKIMWTACSCKTVREYWWSARRIQGNHDPGYNSEYRINKHTDLSSKAPQWFSLKEHAAIWGMFSVSL